MSRMRLLRFARNDTFSGVQGQTYVSALLCEFRKFCGFLWFNALTIRVIRVLSPPEAADWLISGISPYLRTSAVPKRGSETELILKIVDIPDKTPYFIQYQATKQYSKKSIIIRIVEILTLTGYFHDILQKDVTTPLNSCLIYNTIINSLEYLIKLTENNKGTK